MGDTSLGVVDSVYGHREIADKDFLQSCLGASLCPIALFTSDFHFSIDSKGPDNYLNSLFAFEKHSLERLSLLKHPPKGVSHGGLLNFVCATHLTGWLFDIGG